MKSRTLFQAILVMVLLLPLAASFSQAQEPATAGVQPLAIEAALGTAFTYQGRLVYSGAPVNDTCDFTFSLWDAAGSGSPPAGGNQIGSNVAHSGIAVSDGLFTVQLDFGANAFNGDARWLQITVTCGGISATFSPRQPLLAVPYALALPGLRTEQNASSPNLIGGHNGNNVIAGAYGAVIGGGGDNEYPNQVIDKFGTVGGGLGNQAGSDDDDTASTTFTTVSGGFSNKASGSDATVGGGTHNVASGSDATVSGGWYNSASDIHATVSGGDTNSASSQGSTVSGGSSNLALGVYATVGGGVYNSASGQSATVGGGQFNQAQADYSVIAGGGLADETDPATNNVVYDDYGVIGGGGGNRAGSDDSDPTNAEYASVGGGYNNAAGGHAATVSGGWYSGAGGPYATVGGGAYNNASGQSATVGGGTFNWVAGTRATVGGGYYNQAQADYSVIAGGGLTDETDPATNNVVYDDYGVISGGGGNHAGSDDKDATSARYATVGGGARNSASGQNATVSGGLDNTASGAYSFAAGRRAKAEGDGSFVWADSTNEDFVADRNNSFWVRAIGGVEFVTGWGEYGFKVDNRTDNTPGDNGGGAQDLANASRGPLQAGLVAINYGNSPAIYGNSAGTYSGFFEDDILVTGNCVGCTLAYVAVNSGDETLEIGDVVVAEGLKAPLAPGGQPLFAVSRATTGALGIVSGRAVLVESVDDDGSFISAEAAEGSVAPGEHLFIIVIGPARVRVADGNEPIATGQRLTTANQAGLARAQRTLLVDGEPVAVAAPVIGVALESLEEGQGLIWMFVNPQ